MIRLGITGTDTGVGKTTVACALLAAMRQAGSRTAAMKPVETGVAADDPGSDAARLHAVSGTTHPLAVVRPFRFDDPVSPMAAAERTGVRIDLAELDAAFARLSTEVDAIVVEGAGGVLVPIDVSTTVLDLFRRWSLDVIIVAADRLGVLNHTLLTEQAVHASGLRVKAIVLVEAAMPDASTAANTALLARLTATPVLRFPRLENSFDPDALARAAYDSTLATLPGLLQTTTSA